MSGDNPATGAEHENTASPARWDYARSITSPRDNPPPPLGDDEVTALIGRLRNAGTPADDPAWDMAAAYRLMFDAADALERLTGEAAQVKADRNRLVEEWAKDGRVLDRALAAEAERDALPEKIAQAIEAAVDPDTDGPRLPSSHFCWETCAEIARSFGADPTPTTEET